MAKKRGPLHIGKQYLASVAGMDPAEMIIAFHQELAEKFRARAKAENGYNGSAAAAAELQTFFQTIKQRSLLSQEERWMSSDNATIERLHTDVIDSVISRSLKTWGNGKSVLFKMNTGREKGFDFEKELATVINSTLELASGISFNRENSLAMRNKAMLGATKTNLFSSNPSAKVGDLSSDLEQVAQTIVKNTHANLQKELYSYKDDLATVNVDGKIDVSGKMLTYKITASPTSYLGRIARLLQSADITAKSYSSESWDKKVKEKILSQNYSIHLGSTKSNRVYISLFATKYSMPVSISLYMYAVQTSNASTKLALQKLRFIYELTGYGQKYVDNILNEILTEDGFGLHANYLIYNDPSSNNIYVKSTADLVGIVTDNIDKILDSNDTYISKIIASGGMQSF